MSGLAAHQDAILAGHRDAIDRGARAGQVDVALGADPRRIFPRQAFDGAVYIRLGNRVASRAGRRNVDDLRDVFAGLGL
jgi:hypothetical protein